MKIEQFVSQSIGEWNSMRSAHSLAFKQFEEIVSSIRIKEINIEDKELNELILANKNLCHEKYVSPFRVEWEAESNWNEDESEEKNKGTSIFVPIPRSNNSGKMLIGKGYTEAISVHSNYKLSEDGMLTLITNYKQTIAEEKIWFLSPTIRCRFSCLKTSKGSGILQTSFASEIKKNSNEH